MDKHNTPDELIRKYNAGTCTDEERAIVESWHLADLKESTHEPSIKSVEEVNARMRDTVLAHIETGRQFKLWPRVAGIAAAVAAITLGVWLYNISNTPRHPELFSGSPLANDIAPGGNKATIKIGNGEAITLSDKKTGVVVAANGLKYNDGSSLQGVNAKAEVLTPKELRSKTVQDDVGAKQLTVTTPRGGTYQVTLPDGTKVWLNAASVLTYSMPLKERGGIRKVQLSGEAYFEVFRNKNQPFVVSTKKLTTTVLGTHFNISAYEDENNAKATLLEGSVRVVQMNLGVASSRSASRNDVSGASSLRGSMTKQPPTDETQGVVLKPNQQASVTANSGISVKEVNAEYAVAWKQGFFMFNNDNLEDVMERIARWYNVEVEYDDPSVKKQLFFGTISKFENVSKVLNMLQRTNVVKFKIDGKKIVIIKNK